MAKKEFPLEKALRRVSPELEKAVKKALKRATTMGLVLGMLVGFFLGIAVVSFHVAGQLRTNAQVCDLYGFGPVAPKLPQGSPQLCWMDVNTPEINGRTTNVLLCPTAYSVSMSAVPEVNAEVVQRFATACKHLQQQMLYHEVNSEVNG